MNPVPGRVQRRWKYLCDKTEADMLAFIGCAVTCLFGLISILTAAYGLYELLWGHAVYLDLMAYLISLLVLIPLTALGSVLWRSASARSEAIPYVPSVREQIDALPAEEILVRSSEEPPVLQRDVLLRPAGSQATPAEGLLRAVENKELIQLH